MRTVSVARLIGLGVMMLAVPAGQAIPHSANLPISVGDIMRALGGKVCTTRTGAKFIFGRDGQYAYDGLWKNGGHFTAGRGAITVTLDSGMEREFALSRREGVIYMEQTALSCRELGRDQELTG
ncbi:hypothetical protein QNA08_05965 [Chelatococcus sp. SYSU_G07232]|uniref:Uncharacterized protein n=1 Tax=Chelatococcus albus TaxID=3047466 RepID=A0ABT7AEH7_9HYPH|nr:hypothetical protein [Chelatococcus sp. SYSU_G07232]MDJ1157775.1 hypothetical protein [Chelatococcus sp. SYSU_G07232]